MDVNQLIAIVLLSLLVLAVIQFIYWVILSLTAGSRTERRVRQPSAPIMPTHPGGIATSIPGYTTNPPAQRATIGKMVIVSGLPAKEIPLPAGNFGIGRFYNPEQNVQVAMDEKSMSRSHAAFTSNELLREFYLTDNRSSYGTAVQRGTQFEPLRAGEPERIYNEDVVQFGKVIRVRFLLPGDKRPTTRRA